MSVRMGVIGVGRIGSMHADLLARQVPGAEVTWVNDAHVPAAAATATRLQVASGSYGGSSHLAMEYFLSVSGLKMVNVQYRGVGPAPEDAVRTPANVLGRDPRQFAAA